MLHHTFKNLFSPIKNNISKVAYNIFLAQEFRTKMGRHLEVNHEQNFPKDQVRMKPRDQELFTKES